MSAACRPEATSELQLVDTGQLETLADRAADRGRNEPLCASDLDMLRSCGYLVQAVPEELGGLGFPVSQVGCEQRRLACYAPAVALAVHSHLSWTGLAADLWNAGDASLEWLLREAADGEIIAGSQVTAGGAADASDLDRVFSAQPVDGGYCLTGHTHLYDPVPGWSRLAVRGLDRSDAAAPKVVHAFIARDSDGLDVRHRTARETVLGHAAFDAAFVPERYIARVVPRDAAAANPFVLYNLLWAAVGLGSISCGTARAAFDHAVTAVAASGTATSKSRLRVADMAMSLQSIEALLERIIDDRSAGDHANWWPARILGTGYRTSELARTVVDTAAALAGGSNGTLPASWQWLMNEAAPGIDHPADVLPAREIIGGSYLGFALDEAPHGAPQST